MQGIDRSVDPTEQGTLHDDDMTSAEDFLHAEYSTGRTEGRSSVEIAAPGFLRSGWEELRWEWALALQLRSVIPGRTGRFLVCWRVIARAGRRCGIFGQAGVYHNLSL